MFNAKHIIGGISVSLFLWACSDSATSEQEITSLSPEDSIESSSSTDSIEQSSESQSTESSSSEAKVPGAPLDSISIVVNTKTDKCLSFATGKASAETTGDVCFKTFGTS